MAVINPIKPMFQNLFIINLEVCIAVNTTHCFVSTEVLLLFNESCIYQNIFIYMRLLKENAMILNNFENTAKLFS